MKFLCLNIETKKELRDKINFLTEELDNEKKERIELQKIVAHRREKFPFDIGQKVYDLQLRTSKGRYTKTNPSIEHSLINELIVDEENYFGLVTRYKKHDVFTSYDAAYTYFVGLWSK